MRAVGSATVRRIGTGHHAAVRERRQQLSVHSGEPGELDWMSTWRAWRSAERRLAQPAAISPGANSLGVITTSSVRLLLDVQ